MSYQFFTARGQTPQSQPIPGRATEMVQGRAGGYHFDPGIWVMLRRCLLIGTAQNTFYADKHELTGEFTQVVQQCVVADPGRVAQEIFYASDGRSLNNSAPLYALTLLSMGETPAAKQAFMKIFPQVVRTGSHFYEWLSYTKALRGFGKVVRECGKGWLSQDDVQALAYQLLKYQQRYGFSHRDALRLFHVKPPSVEHQTLYNWVINGWEQLPKQPPATALEQIWWYEWLKRNPDQTKKAIAQGHLTHEMVAPIGQMDEQTWKLLMLEMPIGALLRNLGSLTEIGVLRVNRQKNLKHVAMVLNDKQRLRKGRIHPIDILKALKTYQSGGRLGRSKKTWEPVPRIIDILEKALEMSFETVPATGKTFLHAVDVSGSMSYYSVGSVHLTCAEIAATMALVTAKAEKNYAIRGFSTAFKDLGITASDSFRTALQKTSDQNFGGTDASSVYKWALKHRFHADVICFWTDCESWAGTQPCQKLAEYRRKLNPNVKAIYVTLAPYKLSLVDPKDPLSWDLGGFDPTMPRLIQMIAQDDLA
ncbi:TROVE domain-containing protein [Picosynechococcus sp. PCC 7117]|uniref:TROVE domain-containing protein n=1 Tax=Picosynechococcus sp. PCC 7117 TaxID=195498 RepID=UPI000810D33D|nr:TROVE domain-containing protein [Picosynechococcus sp. PCC 7117]ANV88995.1 TROVE domain-containing protein [Picosynechococcus sp. PCC 7117]